MRKLGVRDGEIIPLAVQDEIRSFQVSCLLAIT
jgi:hypothetical protein